MRRDATGRLYNSSGNVLRLPKSACAMHNAVSNIEENLAAISALYG